MNTPVSREARDIFKIIDDDSYFPSLPAHRKTAVVSLAAVTLCGQQLEYVPEWIISKEFEGRAICRAALKAKDADCTLLPHIPYIDVQKEGIRQFSADTPAFVLYSIADIRDAEMARDAVRADAYCIQLVPAELLTNDLCRTALQSPNTDEKVSKFVMERFPELKTEQKPENETNRQNTGAKIKL
jgi:hypothetical protein